MKAVMISIQPQWCELIANGKKTIEVRKTKPKIETSFKCYIYCTYGKGRIGNNDKIMPNFLIDRTINKSNICGNCCNGKVIGEFVCDKIEEHSRLYVCEMQEQKEFNLLENSCLSINDINNYLKFKNRFYGWHITDLKIYDTPKALGEFGVRRPPQSWQYCEELEHEPK